MSQNPTLKDLIKLAEVVHANVDYTFLHGRVYTELLLPKEQEKFTQLLSFARDLRRENTVYELLYHQLLCLFVPNGSRLDLLRAVERRLRGLADGQGHYS